MDVTVVHDPQEPAPSDTPPRAKSLRSHSIPVDLEAAGNSGRSNGRSSIDSSTSDRPKPQAGDADSPKTGSNGLSKLLASRRKRKKKKDSLKLVDELSTTLESESLDGTQRYPEAASTTSLPTGSNSPHDDVSNLLTDDYEPDKTHPLTPHDLHTGFYTSSSPLSKSTSALGANDTDGTQGDAESAVSGTTADRSGSNPDPELSQRTSKPASTLSVPTDRNSKKKGVSRSQRLKNAFSSDKKSARDRASSTSGESTWSISRRSSLSSKKASGTSEDPPPPIPSIPAPIRTDLAESKSSETPEALRLQTPPHTAIPAPSTTVTPPTPNIEYAPLVASSSITESPTSIKSREFPPGVVVSHSGNMISHRRVRSASAANPKASRLSNSIAASPTIEEGKPGTPQSGFFSSVFSVAQSAASTLTNSLNAPKTRSPTTPEARESESQSPTDTVQDPGEEETSLPEEKRPMAVDTLGSGDLNFSHLDLALPPGGSVSTPDGVVITKGLDLGPERRRSPTVSQRDEEAAKLEDRRAARAVTMAYEKNDSTANLPTEDSFDTQVIPNLSKEPTGTLTPSGGSTFEGEFGVRPYRSGSVRSRLAQRRHRGSSGATSSTIGAIGAGAIALGVPGANASLPRLTGFAVASKKRNRDFHQLFRSVPEDDYLIEDYSCALQREIILAGRIYISEGHICFSSNILGWVTTLVISFDEVVAIEKESTAMVFPNAIAIQTLHARHTFRSLLSRESTYDLMVNIWKINHPTLKSSVNGTRVTDSTGDKTEKAGESDDESDEDEDEIYDEDEEEDGADSFFDAGGDSARGSDTSLPTRGPARQASGPIAGASSGLGANGASKGAKTTSGDGGNDFPGPPTHSPTQYDGPEGQYEKVIKDETIPAPLGKVYSYVFGPASVSFVPKFLVENQKSGDLDFNSEKTGLTNENRVRKYSYIKPLNGSIGPKQTKCISTEQLDFLDLEKAVLVTLSTQTPDVPSGNVFATKTKYLFTWAPNNRTRFLMTCTIEWSGKSWLKGPIEKGAIDGQTTFGNDLIAALKLAVAPRARTLGPRNGAKGKARRRKGDAVSEQAVAAVAKAVTEANAQKAESWGIFEPLRGLLGPFVGIFRPFWNGNIAVLVIGVLLFMLLFRGPSPSPTSDMGYSGYALPRRLAAYEEMWRKEETELWNWLEDRVGMDGIAIPNLDKRFESPIPRSGQRPQGERELRDSLNEETLSDREMDHAIRTTRERLDTLERILSNRRSQPMAEGKTSREEL
ncbi:GRAM and VASt domain-containing protein [Aspergillus lucknowensis]|uniref:VASt domain-containing protein n=1 Tax=Aspergillus lucknowensis TaxID=176173 RepID=A0ABR4LQF5_9EURO